MGILVHHMVPGGQIVQPMMGPQGKQGLCHGQQIHPIIGQGPEQLFLELLLEEPHVKAHIVAHRNPAAQELLEGFQGLPGLPASHR